MRYPLLTTTLILTMLITGISCNENPCYTPRFTNFSYSGNDTRYKTDESGNTESYLNPVISGCAPDPSVCRKGSDYYLVNSTFAYFPAIPVWHSTDLVNWELIGYALDRPSQLTLKEGLGISSGIYAPDIKYNPANDTFYIIVTGVGCGGNFIVKSKNPADGWSEPISVPQVGGIDPGFLFDNDGKTYIVNNDAPSYPAEYDGHRAIWIHDYDTNNDKVTGEAAVLVDKGVHPADKPIWIEGPHLYHIGDTYYLMAAEGGTADDHSEVIFTSDSPKGPFKPCAINPILTQRRLDGSRANPVTCTGHADLIETPDGEWWAFFLGVCPYEGDRYCNTGRSTFLLPVRWENDQPIILDSGMVVPTVVAKEGLTGKPNSITGNISYNDNFDTGELAKEWFFLRTPLEKWYSLENRCLEITPRAISLAEQKQPSMVCRWIKNDTFTATTTLKFSPRSNKMFAGLVAFQSERAYYAIGKSCDSNGNRIVMLQKSDRDGCAVVATEPLERDEQDKPILLRIQAKGSAYNFSYSTNNKRWKQIGGTQDGKILSTSYAGGFTGAVIGMYATSSN